MLPGYEVAAVAMIPTQDLQKNVSITLKISFVFFIEQIANHVLNILKTILKNHKLEPAYHKIKTSVQKMVFQNADSVLFGQENHNLCLAIDIPTLSNHFTQLSATTKENILNALDEFKNVFLFDLGLEMYTAK